jgi:hypothetical protein
MSFVWGLAFSGLGLALGAGGAGYPLGTPLRWGPGYFRLDLAVVQGLMGALTLVPGPPAPAAAGDGGLGRIPWRATLLICGAIVFFGATVRGLGLAPTLFVSVALTALASRHTRPLGALVIALGMTVLCLMIFTVGLGLPLAVVGPWLR